MNIQKGIYIENRYEILEKIGSGGMSDVYKTRDIKLNRFVAIKFLKPEYCEDKNFVKNFQIEAQSAAALLHPNVVSVYDVNQTDGTYYIVMEYVDGITLKKYIDRNGKLPVKEATSIAIQIAQGIDAAHNAQIVHRDIKPQNVLISREGKIKVTDFGIARTTTANTISSDILGSVQYISPEQARGGQVDNRTDIYSFGIVYYEMVTGQLPFDGDSTVSIALKHIQENVPLVSDIVPGIPNSVSRIIEKCTQRKPDRRYQKMVSLLADLKTSLITPNEDFVVLEPEPSESATIIMSEEDAEILRREGERLLGPDDRGGSSYHDDYTNNYQGSYQRQRLSQGSQRVHEQPPRTYQRSGPPAASGSYSRYRGQPPRQDRNRRSRVAAEQAAGRRPRNSRASAKKKTDRVLVACGIIAGIVIVILLAVVCVTTFSPGNCAGIAPVNATQPETQPTVAASAEVPSVAGMSEGQARGTLESLGFPVKVLYESSDSMARDFVIRQSIPGGTTAEKGQEITLTVSTGSDSAILEDYSGQEKESVVIRLENLGFRVQVTEEAGTGYAAGTVVRTNPAAGSSVTRDTVIEVIVASGPAAETVSVIVPDVIGYSEDNATAILNDSNLTPWITYEQADGYEGVVFYQNPDAGTTVDAWSQVSAVVGLSGDTQPAEDTNDSWIETEETYIQNQDTEG